MSQKLKLLLETPHLVFLCVSKAVMGQPLENGARGGNHGKTRYEWKSCFLVTVVSHLQMMVAFKNNACGLFP